jgi:L-rhamnose mutarotase
MMRRAFRMSVHPGQATEYAKRHQPIWPELESTLLEHGVATYSIFLDPATNDLFAYVEVDSEERWAAVAGTEVCRRWWRHMRPLMPSNPDDSPISVELREVFHIDRAAASATTVAPPGETRD